MRCRRLRTRLRVSRDGAFRTEFPASGCGGRANCVELRPMVSFFLWFLGLQATLFGLELTPWVQSWFVVPWTNTLAAISAGIVKLFDPQVLSEGKVLQSASNGFAVSIEAGCNGVEATIVLVAAILAFPASWKRKLIGLAIGVVAVQGLNIVRVISLFYIGLWNFNIFEWA